MLRRLSSFLALVCAFGCGSAQRAPEKPRASLLEGISQPSSHDSAARFRYHPKSNAQLTASVELENGSRLFVGHNGERWLYDAEQQRVTPASVLAPETLVAVQRTAPGGWIFVGESGTGYESRAPLGPFLRAAAPLIPLVKVTASERTILGIRKGGTLVASDNAGATWEAVGPAGARFADVMLTSDGKGIALEVPERHWQTLDQGRSWQALPTAPFGIIGFYRGASGILVNSALGTSSWQPYATTPFATRVGSDKEIELPVSPAPAPTAKALLDGHAAVIDSIYYQVVRTSETQRQTPALPKWQLLIGPVDEELSRFDVGAAEGCADLKLAGFGPRLYLACARPEDPKSLARALIETEFLLSNDSGKTWQRAPFTAKALWQRLELAVGAEGAFAVTGVCAAPGEPGCQPAGIHYASDSSARLTASATPAMTTPAEALVFSHDGQITYAIGRRTKNDAAVVFVSRDRARHFEAREIEGLSASYDADGTLGIRAIGAAVDGSISVVIRPPAAEERLLVLDASGRALTLSGAPTSSVALGASGSQAIAVSKDGSDIWESSNGGASWERVGSLPAVVCEPGIGPEIACSISVYCHPRGCELSDSLSRLGWHGQSDQTTAPLPPPANASGVLRQTVKTPIACSYASSGFTAIALLKSLPTADQAALGGYAWFAVAHDPSTGSVVSLRARGGKLPEVERTPLLAPLSEPQGFAYSASLQVEGSAALRYRTVPAHNGRIENVEVAWDDLVHGTLVRTRLPDAGSYRAGDADRNGELLQTAHPDLISITDGGLYLRVHSSSATDQPTYFLERNRVTSFPAVTWPEALPSGRQEIVHALNAHLPIRVLESTAVVHANWQDSHWVFSAETAGWPDPERFGLEQTVDLTYLKGRPALQITWFEPRALRGEAYVLPLNDTGTLFGARLSAPTQADLATVPEHCTAAELNTSARIVSPLEAGMRHPVVVSAPGEPIRVMLTARAVLHGTPEHACAAAFDAESIESELLLGTKNERAILPLDDLEHSWLFRTTESAGGRSDQVEYRMLECRFDPTLEVPAEVFTARGTLIPGRESN